MISRLALRVRPTMLVVQVFTSDVKVRASIPRWAVDEVVRFFARLAAVAGWILRAVPPHRRPAGARWMHLDDALRHVGRLRPALWSLPDGEPFVDVRTEDVHVVIAEMPVSRRALPVLRWRRARRPSTAVTDWRST